MSASKKRQFEKGQIILYLIFLLFLMMFIIFVILFGASLLTANSEIKTFDELTAMVESEPEQSVPEEDVPEEDTSSEADTLPLTNAERFAALTLRNSDFIGWLSIADTGINYPVMYTPYQPEKYLRKDFYGKYSISGVPFFGEGCDLESDNIIIYGHNMKNGTMFSDLGNYSKEDYLQTHPTVKFESLQETAEYEIFAAFYEKVHTQSETDVFRYYNYGGELTEDEFNEFVRQAKDACAYDTGITPQYGDKLLTLSTCAYHTQNGRFVVVARKVSE